MITRANITAVAKATLSHGGENASIHLVQDNAGTIIGVIGLVAVFVVFKLQRKEKEPCWSISTVEVIRDNVSRVTGLTVLYETVTVPTLSVSRIIFWNCGRLALSLKDGAQDNQYRVQANGDTLLLNVSLLVRNRDSSKLDTMPLEKERTQAVFTFDYLNTNDGGVFQIVHTGSGQGCLSVQGEEQNAKPLKRREINYGEGSFTSLFLLLFMIALGAAPLWLVASVLNGNFKSYGWLLILLWTWVVACALSGFLLLYWYADRSTTGHPIIVFGHHFGMVPHGLGVFTENPVAPGTRIRRTPPDNIPYR